MQSPVNGTAPTSAPGRSAPFAADRLRRLARRIVLIAVAVGAGFVVAALFQGPAAADGIRGGSDAEPRREIGGLVEPVLRLTVAQRPSQDASPAAAPLPRVDASAPAGASEPERLRPASLARAAHRTDRSRPAAESPRQSATAVPDPPVAHRPGDSPVVGLITAPLPYVVDLVNTVPIRPAVTAVLHVVDAVLPPVLGAVIVPAATPPLPVPPVRAPTAVPVTAPAPVPTGPMPPAAPALAPVPAATPPIPAAPSPIFVVGPARPTAPAAHLAVPPEPVVAEQAFSGRPVAPVDQDAAGVDDRSKPGPGLVWPVDRQSHLSAAQPCDLVPLLVESRTPAAIARPG
ncbi:hypothetical protein [Micromonospora sp. CPCC 205558]|uniref:hypothetical protein n=1 Tax=Micromonospora sp. CPCC 205558 TaxID=3122403 RepID=UPI002FEF49E9